jgi:hypothetical protein
LVEDVPGETPARAPKTSVATLAAALAALWTVPTAPAAVVLRFDGRPNAPPTEAATTVGTDGADGVRSAAGVALAGVGG